MNKSHVDLSYECHLSFNIKFTTCPSQFEKILRNLVYDVTLDVGAARLCDCELTIALMIMKVSPS